MAMFTTLQTLRLVSFPPMDCFLYMPSMSLGSLAERSHVWCSSRSSSSSGLRAYSRATSASLSSQSSGCAHTKEGLRCTQFPPSYPLSKQGSQTHVAFRSSQRSRPHTAGGSAQMIALDSMALPNSVQSLDPDTQTSSKVLNSLASSRDNLARSATGSIAAVCI